MSLGQVDYGLVGLVGGLSGFVSFINSMMASAVSRFYAVEVGAAKNAESPEVGLETCRKWFNTALMIHTTLPLFLVCVGYPIGAYLIKSFLTIPPDRIDACIWVWRFTCTSCFLGMVSVPFNAMYGAKQEIAELTIYSFATTTLNALFLYYMISHPGVWMVKYSAWTCGLGILPQMIIVWRAAVRYPECRMNVRYLWNFGRVKQLLYYVVARLWSEVAVFVQGQGQALLVNKYMGPRYNASMGIGSTVASHSTTLFGSMQGAFSPAIFNKAGEGDVGAVKRLCFMTFRIGSLLVLLFAIPLAVEIKEVLHIWLVNPPDYADKLCVVFLIIALMESMSQGYGLAILALGKGVMRYSCAVGWSGFVMVAVTWVLFAMGCGMKSICLGLLVGKGYVVLVRLLFGKTLLSYGVWEWFKLVLMPILLVAGSTISIGLVPSIFMRPSFVRVSVVGVLCVTLCLSFSWLFVLSEDERDYVVGRIKPIMNRIGRRTR